MSLQPSECAMRDFAKSIDEVRAEYVGNRQTDAEGFKTVVSPEAALTPYKFKLAEQIAPRPWLYDMRLILGNVSLTASPGGIGKMSLVLAESLEMVTRKSTIGGRRHLDRPLRVWYLNGEDPAAEVERRIAGLCRCYGVDAQDLGDRLFISGRETAPRFTRSGYSGPEIDLSAVYRMAKQILEQKIDVLILDPLGALHDFPENDNASINQLMGGLRHLADEGSCAVELVHHASKVARLMGSELGIAQSRGASALIDGARSARTLVAMTQDDAIKAGVPVKGGIFHVADGKANMAPLREDARWFQITGMRLGNCTPEYPDGDWIGVCQKWEWPDAMEGVGEDELAQVKERIRGGEWRANEQSNQWAGHAIAEIFTLGLGPSRKGDRTPEEEANRARVRKLLKTWIAGGDLIKVKKVDPNNRREAPFIEAPE